MDFDSVSQEMTDRALGLLPDPNQGHSLTATPLDDRPMEDLTRPAPVAPSSMRALSPPVEPCHAMSPPASPSHAPSPPMSPPHAPSPLVGPTRASSPPVEPPCASAPPVEPPCAPSPPVKLPGLAANTAGASSATSQVKRGCDEGTDPRSSKRVRLGTIAPAVDVASASMSAQPKTRRSKANEAISTTSTPSIPLTSLLTTNLTGLFEPAANAPKWFVAAVKKLQSKEIDPRFVTLIRTWAAFEVKEGYNEIGKLDSKHRPTQIGDWIQRGRSEKWNPPNLSTDKFEKQFHLWWYHLQPAWRRENNNDIAWGSITGDLLHLKKPGTNGLLSVVAALFFWGINAKRGTPGWDKFIVYVDDVQAVMSALVWPPASA